jgi:pyruvate kinase
MIGDMSLKKTKIIATIGPVSQDPAVLEKIIINGADCIRLNFSHGTHISHGAIIKSIRSISKKLNRHIAIIADIQGPKMRIGTMPPEGVQLKEGEQIILDCKKREYSGEAIPLPSETFMNGVQPGAVVFLDDGLIHLKITKKEGSIFTATVLKGGALFSNKGINVPSIAITGSILNLKDRGDIAFAIKAGADYLALSFLRTAEDIREARKLIGNSDIKIIAKIERPEALANIDEIIEQADAVMIARGDLGIETPLWELPIRQKEIVERVHKKMKPVIVATQMLDSMIKNPLPTRAEVSDVANAVYDSADAVMLSGESASGKYPLEAVAMMRKVLEATEKKDNGRMVGYENENSVFLSLAQSATDIAEEINAQAILIETLSGESARVISYFRPKNIIVAVTDNEKIACQLALVWGVVPVLLKTIRIKSLDSLLGSAKKSLQKQSLLKKGDVIICVYDDRFKFFRKADINTLTVKSV